MGGSYDGASPLRESFEKVCDIGDRVHVQMGFGLIDEEHGSVRSHLIPQVRCVRLVDEASSFGEVLQALMSFDWFLRRTGSVPCSLWRRAPKPESTPGRSTN